MAARAMGWLWLAHAAAAVVAFVWLGVELVRILVRFDLARDGLAQIGAFFAGYGMFVAATIAVFGWKLARFALGRAAGSPHLHSVHGHLQHDQGRSSVLVARREGDDGDPRRSAVAPD